MRPSPCDNSQPSPCAITHFLALSISLCYAMALGGGDNLIKKRFLALLLCLVLFNSFTLVAFADNRELIVYYAVGSSSAYRYHARSSCPSLTRSTVGEITLEEAAALGLTPCSRCHPPAPDFEVSAIPRSNTNDGGSNPTWSTSSFPSASPSSFQPYTPQPTFERTEPPSFSPFPSLSPVEGSSHTPRSATSTRSRSSSKSKPFAFGNPLFLGAVLVFLAIAYGVYSWASTKIEKAKAKKRRAAEEQQRLLEWSINRPKYLAEYGQKPIAELCHMPEDCYVKDGLPACKHGIGTWGDGYTLYVTYSGKSYHRAGCSRIRSKYTREINACRIQGYSPCSTCCPQLPPMIWYIEYRKIMRIREEYNIEEPHG